MSDDVKKAIGTVRTYINGLFTGLNESHYHDIDRINKVCGDAAQDNCVNLYFNSAKQSELTTLQQTVDTKRAEHVNCRLQNQVKGCENNVECDIYDHYRQNDSDFSPALLGNVARCAQKPKENLADSFINTQDTGRRETMETCLKKFKTWFTPLYDLYEKCDRGTGEVEACEGEQGEFEEKHCTYNYELNETCHVYNVCINEAWEDCIGESTGLCSEVDILVKSRKAENETGERILCLLTVLVDTEDASKKAELDICKQKEYDTSYFNLDCPGEVGPPEPKPPMTCDTEPVSCTQPFLEKYYASWQVNPKTGANQVPYSAVCDCQYKCTSVAGDAAKKPVEWQKNPVTGLFDVCPLLEGWEEYPPAIGCPEGR